MKKLIIIFISIIGIFLSCKKESSIILPKADFTADTASIIMNDSIQFINLSIGIDVKDTSLHIKWYFQGGTPSYSSLFAPKIAYASPGYYLVSLFIENRFGNDSITKLNFINVSKVLPKADFETNSSSIFVDDTVQFINLSKGSILNDPTLSYNWYFQGGTPEYSNLASPGIVYSVPGCYPVKLIVTNNYGQDSIIKTDFICVEGILVGKLNGINIVHKVYLPPLRDLGAIDIDGDGENDIRFGSFVDPSEHFFKREIYVESLNKTQISVYDNHPTWAKRHTWGNILSPEFIWAPSVTNVADFCLAGTECGAFNDVYTGFICFKINNLNTIYGWINLIVQANSMSSFFQIDEYAYVTVRAKNK
jgi:PKD repeat protein